MTKIIKLTLISVIIGVSLGITSTIFAQEPQITQLPTEVILDEKVSPEDLGIKDQRVLPDSPFYFLKEWARKIKTTFTFNKVKKAELENQYANEKLIELKKLAEKNVSPEKIKEATENYKKATEKVKEQVDKIKEKAADSQAVDKFLDKFTEQQILQEKILQKLETQVPQEAFEKIKEAREAHLEKFGEVMTKLEDRADKIKEKVENALDQEEGSQFKNFKNLEILQNIEEKVPEQAKEAIQQAQENALKRLQGDLDKMSPEDQEKFKDYIINISGDKEKQSEILDNLKSTTTNKPAVQEKLLEVREKILEKVIEKNEEKNCPAIVKPTEESCKSGRLIPKKDDRGCITEFKCVIPAEGIETPFSECKPVCKEIGTKSEGWYNSCTGELIKWAQCETTTTPGEGVCNFLWSPVCGKDEKTYSNKCFAKLAGVEIAYQGECKECKEDSDCPQPNCGFGTTNAANCTGVQVRCIEGKCITLTTNIPTLECKSYYWIDKENNVCGYKPFCGLYMYEGLRTFETKEECLKAVQ